MPFVAGCLQSQAANIGGGSLGLLEAPVILVAASAVQLMASQAADMGHSN